MIGEITVRLAQGLTGPTVRWTSQNSVTAHLHKLFPLQWTMGHFGFPEIRFRYKPISASSGMSTGFKNDQNLILVLTFFQFFFRGKRRRGKCFKLSEPVCLSVRWS